MRVIKILFAAACGASLAAACGGSTSSGTHDNTGDDAATGGSSGSTSSGSSSGSRSSSGDDATTGNNNGATCQDSSGCSAGQLCCASVSIGGEAGFGFTEACADSCPAMAYQLCADTSECKTSGDTCTPSPIGMGSYCAPPGFTRPDGGFTRPDGGFTRPDGGFRRDAGQPAEGGSSDAAPE